MRGLAALLLAVLFLVGPAAAADRPFDRACMDEYGRDLCDPVVRAEIRAKFGAVPAEDLAGRGVEGVRVFLIDGYSNDRPLVAILRERGGQPVLEVRTPGPRPRVAATPASAWQWSVSETLVDLVIPSPDHQPPDTSPPPINPGDVPPIRICLHAWVAVVEAIKGGKVTTRIRNACGDDPIYEGAASLTPLGLNSFSGCSELKALVYGGDAARLADCTLLSGVQRFTAAAVVNRLREAVQADRDVGQADLEDVFATDAVFTWFMAPDVNGRAASAARWRTNAGGDTATRLRVVLTSVRSELNSVRVEGVIHRFRRTPKGEVLVGEAPFSQDWKFIDRAWRIIRWDVGAFHGLTE